MKALRDTLKGPRPKHKHTDTDGNTWFCNSPYCEDVNESRDAHPDDGGPQPRF